MNQQGFAKAWDDLRAKALANKGKVELKELDDLFTGRTAYEAGHKGMGIALSRGWGKIPTAQQAVAIKADIKAKKAERKARENE